VYLVTSRISGKPGKRTIVQAADPLMFNDIEERRTSSISFSTH
jgi:hypothetical protein